jgi:hypothetical protein
MSTSFDVRGWCVRWIRSRRRVAIVETPGDWAPGHWSDRPPRGTIVGVLPFQLDRAEAACFAMGHNARVLREGGNTWAVALPRKHRRRVCDDFCDLRSRAERRLAGATRGSLPVG